MEIRPIIKISVLVSLYRCKDFIKSFLEYALNVKGLEEIEFLLLHNDPQACEIDIINKYLSRFPNVNYVKIDTREGLYATWNRGIKLAKGKYIAIWNVDDIRTVESLINQAKALDNDESAMLCYGDFYITSEYGENKEIFECYQNWDKIDTDFLYRHMIGCFPMWKKCLHDNVGFFDENFKLIADYDFQIRTHLNYKMVKANGILGYYLENQPHKLSSQSNLQSLEQTILKMRYGLFKVLDISMIKEAKEKYKIGYINNFNLQIPLEDLIFNYNFFVKKQFKKTIYLAPLYTIIIWLKRNIKLIINILKIRKI